MVRVRAYAYSCCLSRWQVLDLLVTPCMLMLGHSYVPTYSFLDRLAFTRSLAEGMSQGKDKQRDPG
ncbi:hypothetical protein VFPPC_02841 [Pochonia chlamydosporia 170]|uniref:Uncharacterized protein n=1 Tax=Pochonia chlamydosporia 170 TaxID=1380566 RepID=A0A179FYP8_METCM|nr:hypothetical protein VFPPC_02841 [Pochonia chlamydosporia 170]OAQ70358.2 hypothetical protein VFPPC_02841 [Pochonia chlamydosporia 170]